MPIALGRRPLRAARGQQRRAKEHRHLVDACCYVLRTGCAWRLLPSSSPPWQAVYKVFLRWVEVDAQSNRASPQGGECGYDAGQKVKGRKRHILMDTLGLVLALTVTAANLRDRDGAAEVVAQAWPQGSLYRTALHQWCVRRPMRSGDRAAPWRPGRSRSPTRQSLDRRSAQSAAIALAGVHRRLRRLAHTLGHRAAPCLE